MNGRNQNQGRPDPRTGPCAAPKRFVVRRASGRDSREIAKLANLAGGNTLSFLLQGINPLADTLRVYREMIMAPTGMFSHRNCLVAISRGQIVGTANAFPACLIKSEVEAAGSTDRDKLLQPRTDLNDSKSYLLNNIAVSRAYRRRGVGSCLLAAVIDEARLRSFPSVTLHVWADNKEALAFYERVGFREAGRAEIPPHPDLPHTGGSLLLKLLIANEEDGSRNSGVAIAAVEP
jgi:ribosomal protein S18 acetylase RimI-like enzyme